MSVPHGVGPLTPLNKIKECIMKSMTKALLASLMLALSSAPAYAGHGNNIVETAAAAGQFETLIAAAKAAGLAPALTGDGPLTVFAPTDEAFGALPAGTIEALLKPANKDKLATILKYHVIAGRVGSGALADGATLETLAGFDVTISEAEKGFLIDGARIVATDIDASNGVVHVIDRVILPPEQMSRAGAEATIRRAIDRGVPMFNHGNATATVTIYTNAARTLLSSADLSHGERMRLERGLRAGENAQSVRESAWQLRYALDDVRESLVASNDMATIETAMAR